MDNGIENMPAVTAQSNNDTKVWNTYDDWKTEDAITLTGESAKEKTASISSDYDAIGVNKDNWEEVVHRRLHSLQRHVYHGCDRGHRPQGLCGGELPGCHHQRCDGGDPQRGEPVRSGP